MKNILAVIAGLIISVIIFSLFEFLSTMFNPRSAESLRAGHARQGIPPHPVL